MAVFGLLHYFCIGTFLLQGAFGEILKAEYATAKLPVPLAHSQPIYDGKNSIYLFGGHNNESKGGTTQILRYDIESDTIEGVAQMTSYGYSGSVQPIENQAVIYYFGGSSGEGGGLNFDIVKFDPARNTAITEENFRLPRSAIFHTSFREVNSSIVYFVFDINFGGSSTIDACDMSTFTCRNIKNIINFHAYTAVVVNKTAFIFGQDMNTGVNQVLKFDMTSFDVEEVHPSNVAFATKTPAVSNGVSAYILGGDVPNTPYFLVEFNMETHFWKYLDVDNFPLNTAYYNVAPSSVFVEKLNRIYYFGGHTKNESDGTETDYFRNDIWYIDLSPLDQGTTPYSPVLTCDGKPDGVHSHPTDCSKYFRCRDGIPTEFYCPTPLLFDRVIGRCNNADVVDCN